ncbi:MAG: exodeoxyribonuclease alpha subunit [Nocardioidaceae bacterium]|jgi:hypothetical protein|nr:exodeoxyribonuclease alpha subunit [Nocardioidaceae bacterium]
MHGGVKVYRGAASAARAYVESDRCRIDDYYLAEGTGFAERFSATRSASSGWVRWTGMGTSYGSPVTTR